MPYKLTAAALLHAVVRIDRADLVHLLAPSQLLLLLLPLLLPQAQLRRRAVQATAVRRHVVPVKIVRELRVARLILVGLGVVSDVTCHVITHGPSAAKTQSSTRRAGSWYAREVGLGAAAHGAMGWVPWAYPRKDRWPRAVQQGALARRESNACVVSTPARLYA